MSPNPGGGNQFGSYEAQPGYGDVKKQAALTREAPMSGATVAARPLNAPTRGAKQTRSRRPEQTAQVESPMPVSMMASPQGHPPAVFQQIARIPGASPLVQTLFGNA